MKIKQKSTALFLLLIICLSLLLALDFNIGNATSKAATAPAGSELSASLLTSLSNKSHPYILYDSDRVGELREKIASGYSKKAYDFTEVTARKYLSASISVTASASGIIGRQLQSYVAYLSTYGMLSDDNSYFEKAVELVNAAVSQGSVEIYDSINGALCVSDFGYAYALAYDWLYDCMNDTERNALKAEMEEIGSYIYTNSSTLNTWGSNEERRKAWNWNAVTHGALGMISVSLRAHSDWLTLSIERMKGYYTYAVDSTGAAMEGLHYIGYALNTLAPLDCVIKDYTGIELLDFYPNMQKLPSWSMMMTAPYGNEQAAIGQGGKLDNLAATYYIINRYSQGLNLWGFDRTYNLDGSNSFTSDYPGNGWNVPAVIFYENKSLRKKSPDSTTPLIATYQKGQVVATDGWNKTDSLMTFTSGYGYSGCWNHPDNNTFTFFAKGESFVIDLGANYKKSSEHNVVQVDDTGMRYEGGSSMVEGRILANKVLEGGVLYLKGDNADSYNDSVLTESTRQLIYKGGKTPYVIAFDYAAKDSKTHKYSTSFYTDTASSIDLLTSNCAKITGGNGGAVAYVFAYSKEGVILSSATTASTKAIVSENNAVSHNQIMLYITANPDGSMPSISFSTDNSGRTKVTLEYMIGDDICTDSYLFSNAAEPVYTAKKASPEKTEYGTIPAEYASKNDYPFVIFNKEDGKYVFHEGYECWADTTNGTSSAPAGALLGAKECALKNPVILLRRDYDIKTGYYSNLCLANGTITLDLNGYKLIGGNGSLFVATNKKPHNTTIIAKNGAILLESGALVSFFADDGGNGYKFIINFEDVHIGFADGATQKSIVNSGTSNVSEATVTGCELSFINCNFDLVTNAPSGTVTLLNLAGDGGHHRTNAVISGGSIIAGASFTICTINNEANTQAPDSLLFLTSDGGAYTTLTVPALATAPKEKYGELQFNLVSSDGVNSVYTLSPIVAKDINFTPKASVTFDSNLIFNIYIPVHTGLGKVTLNGNAVTLGEAVNGYYRIYTELAAKDAAKKLTLVAPIKLGAASVNYTYTFSTVKYADKLLHMSSLSDTEKTLAKDMLAYIRSAYSYFNDGKSLAEIDTILGAYKSKNTINTKDAKCSIRGLSDARFVLEAKPAVRFYLGNIYTADELSFKVGARMLSLDEAKTGSDTVGDYIEFSLYAYEMTEVFSYTVKDTALAGEYNIISYYADVKAKNNSELSDTVAKFYNYCISVDEYKDYIASNK